MLRKLPFAMVIVAMLIAIPGVLSLVTSSADDGLDLTPGTTGVRSAAERVAFWEDRITGPGDYLNRIQAGTAALELARQSGDKDAYLAAVAIADEALEANPISADARVLRAAAFASGHRFEESLADARAVLEEDPSSTQALAVAGDALLELGRHDEAWTHLSVLYTAQPQSPAVLARMAEFSWDTDDPAGALAYGTQALARANEAGLSAGELSFYAIRLARFHLDTGDVDGAAELAEAAIEVAPDVPAVQSTLGFVRQAQDRPDEAIAAFEAAVADVALREALVELVELYTDRGDTDLADEAAAALAALG